MENKIKVKKSTIEQLLFKANTYQILNYNFLKDIVKGMCLNKSNETIDQSILDLIRDVASSTWYLIVAHKQGIGYPMNSEYIFDFCEERYGSKPEENFDKIEQSDYLYFKDYNDLEDYLHNRFELKEVIPVSKILKKLKDYYGLEYVDCFGYDRALDE